MTDKTSDAVSAGEREPVRCFVFGCADNGAACVCAPCFNTEKARADKAEAALDVARTALREIANLARLPMVDMADTEEQQQRDWGRAVRVGFVLWPRVRHVAVAVVGRLAAAGGVDEGFRHVPSFHASQQNGSTTSGTPAARWMSFMWATSSATSSRVEPHEKQSAR